MKKILLFLLMVALIPLFSESQEIEPFKYDDEIDLRIFRKAVLSRTEKYTEKKDVLYELYIKNKTNSRIDSVFGVFIVKIENETCAIVDFENYRPLKPGEATSFFLAEKFSIITDSTLLRKLTSKDIEYQNKEIKLIYADLAEHKFILSLLNIHFSSGIMHGFFK